jgi:thiol-disulfide isomerase/thioredoxin
MKRFFTNLVLFTSMSIAFSGFTACTNNTTSPSNVSVDGINKTSAETKNNNYPPAPSAIMQAELRDLDGNTFKLEDKKGKVVLVNLWAIWCGPCVAEMPEFARMQDQYRDKGFEVIGLNTGTQDGEEETAEKIKSFAEKLKINYQMGYGNEEIFDEFDKKTRLGGIPQSMLLNREGQMTLIVGGGGSRVLNQIKEAVEKTVNEQ